jgi:hypothetical protein
LQRKSLRLDEEVSMQPNATQVDVRAAEITWIAIATLLVLGLTGCAAVDLKGRPSMPAEDTSYAGVFTGEYIDGKPLYRFPPILVVGSRASLGDL